jgi:glycerophosphoryl diester phosphodiesterase
VRPHLPAVLGHRGLPRTYPENTLSGLSRACQAPHLADGVELDVRFSADEAVYVFHDGTTDRLTGSPGTIEDRTAEEVAGLRVRGEVVPELAQVIASLRSLCRAEAPIVLNVEVKLPRDPARAVALLRPLLDPLAQDPFIALVVSSFDPRVLARAQEAGVPWRLALLYETLDALSCLPLLEGDAPIDLHPAHELVTPDHLAELARLSSAPGTPTIRVWTVDEPARALALAQMGVQGIITNDPGRLRRALWSC